ncbi:MAG: response regulator [Alphaproteobacteria bacterium]|nr:response regulator [Alphaproteobacteria bacterium]
MLSDKNTSDPEYSNISSEKHALLYRKYNALLEKTNEYENYLGHLSHQLRTPLMAIMGYGAMLNPNNKNSFGYLDNLLHAAQTMHTVLSDMPSFNVATTPIQLRPANPVGLMAELKGAFMYEAQEKDITLRLHADAMIPALLYCDVTHLRQVLFILTQNAIKFTQSGSVSVAMNLQEVANGTASIDFVIEDSGVGIAADRLGSLFTPKQAEQKQFGRAGKNLYKAAQLISAMHSTIQCDSVANKGSRFHFLLQLPVYTQQNSDTSISPSTTTFQHDWSQKNLLVVDDHAMNRELLTTMLQKMGVKNIDCAANGVEAIERTKKCNYDLIIMDCQMPHMNGFTATRQIRQFADSTNLPIIGITADVVRADTAKCLACGMNDYYQKPLNTSDLEQLMHKWLQ